jgi:hypothetical protein
MRGSLLAGKIGRGLARSSLLLTVFYLGLARAAQQPVDARVSVQWAQESATSATVPSLMLIPEPPIRKGRPLHESAMAALRSVNTRFVRYMPYCTHPLQSIAELRPPEKDRTSWDFSAIDPDLIAFLEATKGRDPELDFGPIPSWMYKNAGPATHSGDPDEPDWSQCGFGSEPGSAELVDPTGQQVADYFARIASWYSLGGFTDEVGKYHYSGYRYELPWWGVLNEPDIEHALKPEQYTRVYDAVVAAVRKVSPTTKFDGMGLASPTPEFVEYFLDPKHHATGTPINMASFHFYAVPSIGQSLESWQYTVFDQLSGLLGVLDYVDAVRKRLSPSTLINIGELGIYLPEDRFGAQGAQPVDTTNQTPSLYWNLAAAFQANAFIELSRRGADVITASQLIGYPPVMFPSLRMIDPRSGSPLPSLQVLRLLSQQLSTAHAPVHTTASSDGIAAQAFRTDQGSRLLLVNKRARTMSVLVDGGKRVASFEKIDETGTAKAVSTQSGTTFAVDLQPFAVVLLVFN